MTSLIGNNTTKVLVISCSNPEDYLLLPLKRKHPKICLLAA